MGSGGAAAAAVKAAAARRAKAVAGRTRPTPSSGKPPSGGGRSDSESRSRSRSGDGGSSDDGASSRGDASDTESDDEGVDGYKKGERGVGGWERVTVFCPFFVASLLTHHLHFPSSPLGGYHPVRVGDAYGPSGRYIVLSKLGWGHFSTVWLVEDIARGGAHAALKIQKSAPHYTEAARDEITLLTQIRNGDPDDQKHCVRLIDAFDHSGPHGRHVCMVFERLGDNLLSLIKAFSYRGVPLPAVRELARQVLVGLDYLHSSRSIIHTDLKPENVMLASTLRPRSGAGAAADLLAARKGGGGDGDDAGGSASTLAAPSAAAAATAGLSRGQKKKLKARAKKDAPTVAGSDGGAAPAPPRRPKPPPIDTAALAADLPRAMAKIVDFGNACWTHKQFTSDIQTRQYRCPEVREGGEGEGEEKPHPAV